MANSDVVCFSRIKELLENELEPLSTKDIRERLALEGISCDRRTVWKYLDIINDSFCPVFRKRSGKDNVYWIEKQAPVRFKGAELQILLDCVHAASFVDAPTSERLSSKLASLGDDPEKKELLKGRVVFNPKKHTNPEVEDSTWAISEAVRKNRKIRFKYFDLDENKERVYRYDGQFRTADPAFLAENEDKYYLVCWDERKERGNRSFYRVDRMSEVSMLDDKAAPETLALRNEAPYLMSSVFRMFSGKGRRITLRFDKSVLNSIYDRFGEKINVRPCGDGKYQISAMAETSGTFYGWVFQFGNLLEIVSPRDVREEFKLRCLTLAER